MTEAEWFSCSDPTSMLEFIEGKVSDRLLRLISCAIVRHVPISRDGKTTWELLPTLELFASPECPGITCHTLIETVERAVDQGVTDIEWEACLRLTDYIAWGNVEDWDENNRCTPEERLRGIVSGALFRCVSYTASEDLPFLSRYMMSHYELSEPRHRILIHSKFESRVCKIIRDVNRNPFRDWLDVDPAWLVWNEGAIPRLAKAIYMDRGFDRTLELADALESAGCLDTLLLGHLRGPGPHVRGCWVIDLLMECFSASSQR